VSALIIGHTSAVATDKGVQADAAAAELSAPDVEAVMLAARLLVAISAQSVAAVDDIVTLLQLRVLVMVSSRGPLNLGAVAAGLGVHPSNATRTVDRLVVAGLLSRTDDPTDRRNLVLELTPDGRTLVEKVMNERRAAIARILERMPASRRRALVPVLRSFAAAGGEVPADAVWSLGWTTAG
jgi:DNA-binding MarR family transcriptional regulator